MQLAAELANDLPRLSELRSTLRQRMEQSVLTDAPMFAKNMESAYRRANSGLRRSKKRGRGRFLGTAILGYLSRSPSPTSSMLPPVNLAKIPAPILGCNSRAVRSEVFGVRSVENNFGVPMRCDR